MVGYAGIRMQTNGDKDLTGFRVLLAAGAVISLGLAIWGLFGGGFIHGTLGLTVERDAPGFIGLSRLYGAVMLSMGLGYVLAAAHPMRNRGLLVVLFAQPMIGAIVFIVGTALEDFGTVNGTVLATLSMAYCLLYFRLYPRPISTLLSADDEQEEPPPPGPPDPGDVA